MSQALPFLTNEQFRQVVASTPLVSIDLILSHEKQVLLGQRLNRPAQGYWFVPGGRIRKNEPLKAAFQRLTLSELGVELNYDQASFLGACDHFYNDSMFDESSSTHYVALGFYQELGAGELACLPRAQHSEFKWWGFLEALTSDLVHEYTKDYLEPLPSLKE